MTSKALTGGRESDLLAGPIEQRDTEFALELAHRRRQRGLHHVCPLGCAREAHLRGNREELLKLTKLHIYRIDAKNQN